jgi:predicted nuclease of predicted toxin-antitoxin system
MSKFLANENVPTEAVELTRLNGLDLAWVREIAQGAEDDTVLALSLTEGRVLVTFDKDFGDLAFHQGKQATCGIVLLWPRVRNPDYVAQFMLAVLTHPVTWEGHFSVARERRMRVLPLPQ